MVVVDCTFFPDRHHLDKTMDWFFATIAMQLNKRLTDRYDRFFNSDFQFITFSSW